MSKRRLGILLSGRGSNFEAIAANVLAGKLDCDIGFVFSNRSAAPGLARARELGLPCGSLESKGLDRESYDRQIVSLLREHQVDLICLAGYMRLLSGYFVREFAERVSEYSPVPFACLSGPRCPISGLGAWRESGGVHGSFCR